MIQPSSSSRREHDLLGDLDIANKHLYGVQTKRAIDNFAISGVKLDFYKEFMKAFAIVKKSAAAANHAVGFLDERKFLGISQACEEIVDGFHYEHFTVDMIQGGAGTSTNMNANEVIANRALEIMGHQRGEYKYCHPNNDVNMSQSTNDAYPTALKLALILSSKPLIKELKWLIGSLEDKEQEFTDILKMGRTQLQDAVPMTLGQTFGSYATTLKEEIERIENNATLFYEVNMGGTAIGTGLNASPDYMKKVIEYLAEYSGYPIVSATNLVEATQDTGAFIMFSSAIKRLAIKLSKMCNDLRLLSSGPRAGLNEINLPAVQPGSSIMPGKVNPVIPEVVNQIAFKVMGNDLTVNLASEAGQLELNAFEPIIAYSLFESMLLLKNGMNTLRVRCIEGIEANEEVCRQSVNNSIGLVTALSPILGYEVCTRLAQKALSENDSIYNLVLKEKLLSEEDLEQLLSPEGLTRPQLKEAIS